MKIRGLLLIFCIFTSCSPTRQNQQTDLPQVVNSEKTPESTSFSFIVQGGKEIKAEVLSKEENSQYVAIFKPPVEPTDGNLYMIALTMLETFYGKGRGLIQLQDAKLEDHPAGKFYCWQISNPTQKFCLSHIRNSDTDKRFGGAIFFVK